MSQTDRLSVAQQAGAEFLHRLVDAGLGDDEASMTIQLVVPVELPLQPLVDFAALAGLVFQYAGLRFEPAAPGELLGMIRAGVWETAQVPKLTPPKRAHPLLTRRPIAAILRPEHGALAILGMAVALALFMALMPAATPLTPLLPTVEYVQ